MNSPSIVMTILAFLAIASGAALDTAIRSLGHATTTAFDRVIAGGSLPGLRIHGDPRDVTTAVACLRKIGTVRSVATRRAHRVAVRASEPRNLIVIVAELGLEAMASRGYVRVEGEPPKNGELLLHAETASRLELGIGDRIEWTRSTGRSDFGGETARKLKVSGIFHSPPGVRGLPLVAITDTGTDLPAETLVAMSAEAFLESTDDERDVIAALRVAASALVSPEALSIERNPLAAVTRRARQAMATTLDLAAWMAQLSGLVGLVAVCLDRLRRSRERIDFYLAIGIPPIRLYGLLWLPTVVLAACSILAGAYCGSLIAGSFREPLAAWASLQAGHGILLPQPNIDALGMIRSLLVATVLIACVSVSAIRARSGRHTLRREHTRSRRLAFGILALASSLVIHLSGATGVHSGFRVISLAAALGGFVLLVHPLLDIIVARLPQSIRGMVHQRVLGETSGMPAIGRVMVVVLALAVSLDVLADSLENGISAEAERRFPGDVEQITSRELLGIELDRQLEVEQAPRRESFRRASGLVIGTLDQFSLLLLGCGTLSLVCLVIAESGSRRREAALLIAIGAPPEFPARWNAWALGILATVCAILAILAGWVLAGSWCHGTLRDALGWEIEVAALAPSTIASPFTIGALLTVTSALTAWRSRSQPGEPRKMNHAAPHKQSAAHK